MRTHFIKFFILFMIGLGMLYIADTKWFIALSYFVIIISIYFMLSAYILKKKGY